ncbi:hypothetical protein F5X99DRAFT_284249 [Biscogniauxia marginata]|nr:hypothetical protein F5X99DRAFT_284249 [Biscogniauxia marginata]
MSQWMRLFSALTFYARYSFMAPGLSLSLFLPCSQLLLSHSPTPTVSHREFPLPPSLPPKRANFSDCIELQISRHSSLQPRQDPCGSGLENGRSSTGDRRAKTTTFSKPLSQLNLDFSLPGQKVLHSTRRFLGHCLASHAGTVYSKYRNTSFSDIGLVYNPIHNVLIKQMVNQGRKESVRW